MSEPTSLAGSAKQSIQQQFMARLGVDTGGTFTDFALLKDGQFYTHKVLSTPKAPELAILQGIEEMGLSNLSQNGQLLLVHGSTVATNAALQGLEAKTLFITNQGLQDILTIGRQNRADIYNLRPASVKPPVAESDCLEVTCRVDSKGDEIEPLSEKEINRLISEVANHDAEALAICLLFSYLNPDHEKRLQQALAENLFVSISSEVLAETGEYERAIATWLNASLGPLMHSYLSRLSQNIPVKNLSVMQSSGGTIGCRQASEKAVNLLLSGPAGGLAAAQQIKQELDCENLLTFDMGGTSTDVALVKEKMQLTRDGKIGRYPVAVPMVDMHTIGAGGGSIAYIDEAGMLHVGPESAGARPGPACYGLGGETATVTDAHVVLGNLYSKQFAGGSLSLDPQAAVLAIEILAQKTQLSLPHMALGILDLANEHMARALRQISVQRGEDPSQYRLCSFGGAGGLHVCALAEKLEMNKALIPFHSGILSALGMLVAPGKREISHAINRELSSDNRAVGKLLKVATEMAKQGREELIQEGFLPEQISASYSLDCRYLGQSFTLNLEFSDTTDKSLLEENFHSQHEKNFGYRLNKEVEWVNLRAHVQGIQKSLARTELKTIQPCEATDKVEIFQTYQGVLQKRLTPVFDRTELAIGQQIIGPALISEASSTSWIASEWIAEVHKLGHLILQKQG